MKTIGLIGGMSWESTAEYYRIINETVRDRLGGLHSAHCILYSVDFAGIEELQREGRWSEMGSSLADAARALQRAGAGCVVLATNTMHKVADDIEQAVETPFLHIADATAERICAQGIRRVGLLGTRYTMAQDFYKGRLSSRFGLDVLVPEPQEQDIIHRIIFEELVLGIVKEDSRQAYREVMAQLGAAGAQSIILGCTEIGLLVRPDDSPVPLFDTTRIHAEAAVDWALSA